MHRATLCRLGIYGENARSTGGMGRGGEGVNQRLQADLCESSSCQGSEVTPSITTGSKITKKICQAPFTKKKNPADQRSPILNGNHQNMTFISDLVCISMRNSGALGPAPCPRSSVPNAASPTKSVPSSCDSALGGPPFPWCSCSSPVPGGLRRARFERTRRRRPKPGRCNTMDICFSSRWENSPDPRD